MEQEIWKDIPGYEGLYQVSSFGRIKSLWYWSSKILKPWSGKVGRYMYIVLCKDYKSTFSVHRLVAQAFLWLNIDDKTIYVCHKDDNTSNNRVDNLFLWTCQDNVNDMLRKWRSNYKTRNKKINQYTLDWVFIQEWESVILIERLIWVSSRNIPKVCLWKRNTAWWFIWKYST